MVGLNIDDSEAAIADRFLGGVQTAQDVEESRYVAVFVAHVVHQDSASLTGYSHGFRKVFRDGYVIVVSVDVDEIELVIAEGRHPVGEVTFQEGNVSA